MKKVPETYESRHPKNIMRQVVMSFYYAFDGLFYVMLTQRNMRFHFSMALWVMCFAVILELPVLHKSFLFIIITFVFAMETLNTCIENLVNLLSPDKNEFAKVAKDTAAAAVLVVSIGSLMAAGYLLMGPFFGKILNPDFWRHEVYKAVAVGLIVGSVLLFWLTRALRLPMRVLLILSCAISAFAITYLSIKGGDWLAFCAMMFFSFLLFNSLTRLKTSVLYPAAGHVLGAAAMIVYHIYK